MANIPEITIDGANYKVKDAEAREQISDLKSALAFRTDKLYSEANAIPNPVFVNLDCWNQIGAGTFATYKVNDAYNALRLAADGTHNPIAYTDIRGVTSIRYFKMTTVGGNQNVDGNLDIVGYPTEVSSGGTILYSSGNIRFINGDGTDRNIEIDMGSINCASYHHIRLILTLISKTKTLLAYKMYLGSENDRYSYALDILLKSQENPLIGKKLFVDGDSICYGAGYTGGYAKIIAEKNLMTVTNLAVSGGTIASGTYSSGTARHWIAQNLNGLPDTYDYYIIEGGFNDAGNNVNPKESDFTEVISTAPSSDYNSTYGAMERLCYELAVNHKGKKVGFIFPHKIAGEEWTVAPGNSYDYTWGKYKELQKKVLRKWGVPFIDLSEVSTMDTIFSDVAQAYTLNGDQVHPNEEGYTKYYVPKIEAWMKTL